MKLSSTNAALFLPVGLSGDAAAGNTTSSVGFICK